MLGSVQVCKINLLLVCSRKNYIYSRFIHNTPEDFHLPPAIALSEKLVAISGAKKIISVGVSGNICSTPWNSKV